MKLNYFLLLLVAVILTASSANVVKAEAINQLRDQETSTYQGPEVESTHRNLKGRKKTTVTIDEERLALPSVKNAVSKLKSVFAKNPDFAKSLKQTTPGVGINLSNPAIRKELKLVAGLLAFIIGTPLLAVGISRVTNRA